MPVTPACYYVFLRVVDRRARSGGLFACRLFACRLLACRQLKWLGFHGFLDSSASNALDANFHRLGTTARLLHPYSLQIGSKLAAGDSGFLGTNSTKIFRFTTRFHRVTHGWLFATDLTYSRHRAPAAFQLQLTKNLNSTVYQRKSAWQRQTTAEKAGFCELNRRWSHRSDPYREYRSDRVSHRIRNAHTESLNGFAKSPGISQFLRVVRSKSKLN